MYGSFLTMPQSAKFQSVYNLFLEMINIYGKTIVLWLTLIHVNQKTY